jgi:SM-20-related protein
LERTEAHFAVYPRGAFYSRHLDQFKEHSNRIFSVILYLNEQWQDGQGGELRVFTDHGAVDYARLFGRLIIFRSDAVEHEVLETFETRISLTGWMRRDAFVY